MKREMITPNRLKVKEIQALINDGFDVPTEISKSNEKFWVLIGKEIYTDKYTKQQTKRIKVVSKNDFDYQQGLKRISTMKNGAFILHNPHQQVEVQEPIKEVVKEKRLSNTTKGKIKTLHSEGMNVEEIAVSVEEELALVTAYVAKLK